MSMNDVKLDSKKLDALIKEISNRMPTIKVGIMGEKASRADNEEMNNAEIGAVHEFGSEKRKIPQRSFLRMPLETKLPDAIEKLKTDKNQQVNVKDIAYQIGAAANAIIEEAFLTEGFGQWPKTKHLNMGSSTLLDTGKLSQSIAFEVET